MSTKHAEQLHACIHTFICTHPYAYTVMQCECVYNNVCMYVCTHAMYGYTYKKYI